MDQNADNKDRLNLQERPTVMLEPFKTADACCGALRDKGFPRETVALDGADQIETRVGAVPQVSATLTWRDRWGAIKARWGVGRMAYLIAPGLYALGRPTADSPVLVTSNYKMSFDRLRGALPEEDAWILVLDTRGINVWCAAGKGTFGTQELLARVGACGLERVVTHRRLILPQLAAPGVAAHLVKKHCGFEVIYGPVRAEDLAAFLKNGLAATREMRRKSFDLKERLVLIPIELVAALKAAVFVLPVFFLAGGLGGGATYWSKAATEGLFAVSALTAAVLAGSVAGPILLPWLPGRAFSAKGFFLGTIAAIGMILYRFHATPDLPGAYEMTAWGLLIPAVTAYLMMNFTGASTYTSLSGVKKEMRWAVPAEIASGVIGLGLWILSRFVR